MTFKENLNRLCLERGTYLTTMLRELGFSSSKATAINNGQIPNREETLLKIAEYLNCSIMDFFADEPEDSSVNKKEAVPQNEDEEDILRIYRSLSRRSKHEFMSMVYEYENRVELEGDNENIVRNNVG